MGHKGNRCQTEYSAVTWRTTWPWQRSAGSDCFLVAQAVVFFALTQAWRCLVQLFGISMVTSHWLFNTFACK